MRSGELIIRYNKFGKVSGASGSVLTASLRAQRSNPSCKKRKSGLLRFARNDGFNTWVSLSPRECARGIEKPSTPKRAWGMPGAQCTRSLVCEVVVEDAHEYSQRSHRKSPGIPARNGFTAYVVLSPAIGLSCHRRLRKSLPANLTPASRRQDHTILPSASKALSSEALARGHRIQPRVRDDRDTPLEWGGRRRV